jgi:hypothetical protein
MELDQRAPAPRAQSFAKEECSQRLDFEDLVRSAVERRIPVEHHPVHHSLARSRDLDEEPCRARIVIEE